MTATENRPRTVACLGDSVTARPRGDAAGWWMEILSRETAERWIDHGLVGDTSGGMLSRLDANVLPEKPDMVFLLGGWNDLLLGGNTQQLRLNMHAMVHHCVHAKAVPVIGIPYRFAQVPGQWKPLCPQADLHQEWERYLEWLRCFCQVFHLRNVDIGVAFPEDGSFLRDGLHPNGDGHRAIADALKNSGYFGS